MAWNVANFTALAVTLMLLSITSVVLRFWVRKNSTAKFGVDDVLIIPAAVHKPSSSFQFTTKLRLF
jgi:hypothetical protein